MGKKRTLAIILLLCVLGGLIACGRKEKEDEYTYTIKLTIMHRAVSSFPPVVICGFTL